MKGTFPVNKFRELETPFYYYDVNVLRETLSCINKEAGKYNNFCVHYAVKANANHKIPVSLYTSPSPRDGLLPRMPSSA